MAKLKTHKATAKRFTRKKHTMLKRKAGQDHFNTRESGKTRMGKRRDVSLTTKRLIQTAKRMMPYS